MGQSDKWGLVRIPKELQSQAERAINSDKKYIEMGFTSLSSFVTFLLQREFDRYSKLPKK